MIISKILISATQPSRNDIAWAKPFDGGFALYLCYNGKWQPVQLVDSKGTMTPEDDQAIDVTNIPSIDNLDGKIHSVGKLKGIP